MSTPEAEGSPPDVEQTQILSPEQIRQRRKVSEVIRDWFSRKKRKKPEKRQVQEPQRQEHPDQQQPQNDSAEDEQPPRPAPRKENARENRDLAHENSSTLQILPGDQWAMHYPNGPEARNQAVERLFAGGSSNPAAEVINVRPDTLIYDEEDITRHGQAVVRNRIHDTVTAHEHYDYQRFTEFIAHMSGAPISASHAQRLYDTLARDRIQQVMLSTYDAANEPRIRRGLQAEGQEIGQTIDQKKGMSKILSAAKSDVLLRRQLEDGVTHDAVMASLTAQERAIFDELIDNYRDFTQKGNPEAFNHMAHTIRSYYTDEDRPPEEDAKPAEQKPEDFIDPPPETEKYPPKDKKEQEQQGPSKRFEITPKGTSIEPLLGYYPRKHENVYDYATHDWVTPSDVRAYAETIAGDERQMIRGKYAKHEITIRVPEGYALDLESLTFTGERPSIGRDQFGNFKILGKDKGMFTVDFLKEEPPFIRGPEDADFQQLHNGPFAQETEEFFKNLTGTDSEKAEAINDFIFAHHIYPSAEEAITLQSELRSNATADTYIPNLESSNELECYSANTLFVAMARRAGIASRLVLGDYIKEATDGKAIIDESTRHAWSEVWEGTQWVIFDATPPKMSEEPQESSDGNPSDAGAGEPMPKELFPQEQAGEREVQEGQERLAGGQEAIEQAGEREMQAGEAIREATNFQQMKDLLEQIQADDALFDDMKEKLGESIKIREQEMREELQEKIIEMGQKGFMDEARARELLHAMQNGDIAGLDEAKNAADTEGQLFDDYRRIRAEVLPFVENAYRNLVKKLPKYDTVQQDRMALTDEGELDMEAVMDPDSFIRGEVFSPLRRQHKVMPKILMKFVVDTSGSTKGDVIDVEKKLLVAYSELVSRIERNYGYIRFSVDAFSENVMTVKNWDQSYSDTKRRYKWEDGTESAILVRMMQAMTVKGGTNILEAVRRASRDVHSELATHRNYITAVQFLGDGGDSYENQDHIRQYMQLIDVDNPEVGFGPHLFSAIMLERSGMSPDASKALRSELSYLFQDPRTGDERTTIAGSFPELFQQSVAKFAAAVSALRIR